jgi:hypothetical protein
MNSKTIVSFLAASIMTTLMFSGCGSVPSNKVQLTKEEILSQPDVKDHPPVVFDKNLDEVRQAGLRALTFVGCEIKAQQPLFLYGSRPHKVGLFVGSGGETVKIFLYPQSDNETHVWVDTDLSFFGMAGQQGWNKQVIEQMTQLLNHPTTTK